MASPEHLTYLGHATVLVEVEGVRVLTDPVLRPGATFLRRVPHAADLRGYTQADIVLISHLHHDHLDLPSLRMLNADCVKVVPRGAGAWLRSKSFQNVRELAAGESAAIGPVTITATFASHSGRREPVGPTAMAVGYLVSAGPSVVYFAGDTGLFPQMRDIAEPGTLDVALIPVWGWGPGLGPGHLNPRSAARAVEMLQPRYAVPIHWGTLSPAGMHRLRLRHIFDPPHEFARAVSEIGLDVKVLVTTPGQRVAFIP